MKKVARFLPLSLLLFLVPHPAHAVLPPDVIFNVGTQLWSLFAGIGVIIFGSILAIVPFIKGFFEKMRSVRWVLVLSTVALFFGASCALFYVVTVRERVPALVMPPIATSTTASLFADGHRFFSDRFVIVGKTDAGEPLLINFDINRKEGSHNTFEHYYMGDIVSGGKSDSFYEDRMASGTSVLPDLFFTHFEQKKASDHSARETFTFTFALLGKIYTVTTDELVSDFITKNEPDYTSYEGVGKAKILVDGKELVASIMHQGTYSIDYRPTIFFEGSDTLRSDTTQLIFWDEAGDFYLIDKSDVKGSSPSYASHLWALTKHADGTTQKSFRGTVEKGNSNGMTHFLISLPDFSQAQATLVITHAFKDKTDEGWMEGDMTTIQGTKKVYGLGFFHIYGKGN